MQQSLCWRIDLMNKSNVAKFSLAATSLSLSVSLNFLSFFSFSRAESEVGFCFDATISFYVFRPPPNNFIEYRNTASLLYQLVYRYDKRNWTKITLSLMAAAMMRTMMMVMATTMALLRVSFICNAMSV